MGVSPVRFSVVRRDEQRGDLGSCLHAGAPATHGAQQVDAPQVRIVDGGVDRAPVPLQHAEDHGGWTIHSAGRNRSDHLRTVMTVIYYADGARVLPEVTDAQEVDRRAWLGGRPLGAVADHELNPVL